MQNLVRRVRSRTGVGILEETAGECADSAVEEDSSIVHDDAVIHKFLHILYNMRGHEHRLPLGLGVVAQILDKESAVAWIKSERKVVQHEQIGILGQYESQSHLRFLSIAHIGNLLARGHLESGHQLIVGVPIPLRIEFGVELLYLLYGHKRVLDMAFKEQRYPRPGKRADAGGIFTEDRTASRCRFEIAHQDIDGCCLAGPVLTEQAGDCAFGDIETQVRVNTPPAIIMRQAVADYYVVFHSCRFCRKDRLNVGIIELPNLQNPYKLGYVPGKDTAKLGLPCATRQPIFAPFFNQVVMNVLLSVLAAALQLFSLSGFVRDAADSSPLSAATVTVQKGGQTFKWAVAGDDGRYVISDLPAGKYVVNVSYIGYLPASRTLVLDKNISLSFRLAQDAEQLNEVVVTATENHGVTSSTRIGVDAIAHIQPSSFADILELMPGGMAKDPSLSGPQLINLRSANALTDSDYATSALGTRFMVDGRPLDNDANLQSTPAYSNYGSSYVNFGTDMREISTEDIENVDIVRGIASVRYGDLTSGLVNIIRKRGGSDLHARFKSDMKSKLFYLGKGFERENESGRTTLNTSINFLDSRADPRQTRQNWKRLTASLRAGKDMRGERYVGQLTGSLDYTGSFDNQKSDVDLDITEGGMPIETYSSAYNKFSLSGGYILRALGDSSFFRSLETHASLSYERDLIDRWKHNALGKATPVSTSLEPGEHDALIIPAKYDATLQVDGRPFYMFFSASAMFSSGVHKIQTGAEWNMDKNFGRGTIFDTSRPFSTSMGVRPRPYSAIPATHQFSVFAEDHISKSLGNISLDWVLGLRAEMMAGAGNGYEVNMKPYLDPRTNMRIALPTVFLRGYKLDYGIYGGIGRHTKFPTMDMLFPDPIYGDVTLLNYWPVEENLRRVNLLVYKIDPTNTALQPASNLKWEVGADADWNGYSFSIDWFREDMTSGFRYASEYLSVVAKKYDASAIDKSVLTGPPSLDGLPYQNDTILTAYSFNTNGSRTLKQGLEFSFSTRRIKAINTRITANGAWLRTEYMNSQPEYYRPNVMISGKPYPYIGIYEMNDGSFYDSLVTNLMFDTQIPSLGLIFSTSFQCKWFSGHRSMPESKYPDSYIDKAGTVHPFDTAAAEGDAVLRHLIRDYTESLYQYQRTPFAMNVNLKVSKKLYHDKVSCSLYVNKIFDVTPDYWRGDALVRRSVTPYFGMELDFKI